VLSVTPLCWYERNVTGLTVADIKTVMKDGYMGTYE